MGRKGVAIWVWIAGGIIIGFLIFIIAYSQLIVATEKIKQSRVLEQWSELGNIINNLCWSFIGNEREYKISFSEDVALIYLTDDVKESFPNPVELIKNQVNSTGKNLCLSFYSGVDQETLRPRCIELECNSTMPYLGAIPPEQSLIALLNRILGGHPRFEPRLKLKRLAGEVKIERVS